MLEYCQLDPKKNIWMKFLVKIQNISFKKMHLQILYAKGQPFVLAWTC